MKIIYALVIVFLCFSSCSDSSKKLLIGSWENYKYEGFDGTRYEVSGGRESPFQWKFYEDGTGFLRELRKGSFIDGNIKWSIKEDKGTNDRYILTIVNDSKVETKKTLDFISPSEFKSVDNNGMLFFKKLK